MTEPGLSGVRLWWMPVVAVREVRATGETYDQRAVIVVACWVEWGQMQTESAFTDPGEPDGQSHLLSTYQARRAANRTRVEHALASAESDYERFRDEFLAGRCDADAVNFYSMRAAVALRPFVPDGASYQRDDDLEHLLGQNRFSPTSQVLQFAMMWAERRHDALRRGWEPTTDLPAAIDLLLSRAQRTAHEISLLLKFSYASAAFGRWRTLHESAIYLRLFAKVVDGSLKPLPGSALEGKSAREVAETMADGMLLQGAAEEVKDIEQLLEITAFDPEFRESAEQSLALARLRLAAQVRERDIAPVPGKHWVSPLMQATKVSNQQFAEIARVVLGVPPFNYPAWQEIELDEAASPLLVGQKVLYPMACADLHVSGQARTSGTDRLTSTLSVDQVALMGVQTFQCAVHDALGILAGVRCGPDAAHWEGVLTDRVLQESLDSIGDTAVWGSPEQHTVVDQIWSQQVAVKGAERLSDQAGTTDAAEPRPNAAARRPPRPRNRRAKRRR